MKKILVAAGFAIAGLVIFYGAVSALVNQGHSLTGSIVTFVLVVVGALLLIRATKSD